MVKLNAEKSGLPTIAAINGVKRLVTNEVTTAPKAAPITTATARSITLPRIMNCRKPLNIRNPYVLVLCHWTRPSPKDIFRGPGLMFGCERSSRLKKQIEARNDGTYLQSLASAMSSDGRGSSKPNLND